MRPIFFIIVCLLFLVNIASAEIEVQITALSGDVKIRYGLEEKWHKAAIGLVLKEIDTIFNGEDGKVTLKLNDNSTFYLGPNSVIDISDLRIIKEKEMFLILMSQKIDQIEPRNTKTQLRVGNVSVIHGMYRPDKDSSNSDAYQKNWSLKEINGAKALYEQKYYSNSIIKLHDILNRYNTLIDQSIIYFYIAKGFKALNQKGQAVDAYQKIIEIYNNKIKHNKEDILQYQQAKSALKDLNKPD